MSPWGEVWEVCLVELELSGCYLDLRKNAATSRVEVNEQKPRRQTQHWVTITYPAPRHEGRPSTSQVRASGSLNEDEGLFSPSLPDVLIDGPGWRYLGTLISLSGLSSPGTGEWAPSPRARKLWLRVQKIWPETKENARYRGALSRSCIPLAQWHL